MRLSIFGATEGVRNTDVSVLKRSVLHSPHVIESKTFLDCGFHAMDS